MAALLTIRSASVLRSIRCIRRMSDMIGPKIISTPIFYVNAAPHIGHLYSALIADCNARWRRLKGEDVLFCTGTDEHGLKIQNAAANNKMEPQEYCDGISKKFKSLFDECDISYDDFIRTTEERHKIAVTHLWNKLVAGGHIYQGTYSGWYSVSDEAFLTESQITTSHDANGKEIKVSIESGQIVIPMSENNYMFRLSNFTSKLKDWLKQNPNLIRPANRLIEVQNMLEMGLPDLSISRLKSTLNWGIQVPNDATQTIYVWLDALTNYLTIGNYPKNIPNLYCHILGKDIIKFHAIYWPAFLMAAEIPLPNQIISHSHWTVDGFKMSKSRGNVVDPAIFYQKYGVDCLRYFLLKEGRLQLDGDFSESRLLLNANELANTIGNLLARCTSLSINKSQFYPALPLISNDETTKALILTMQGLLEKVDVSYLNGECSVAIELIVSVLRELNRYFELLKPWELAKNPNASDQLSAVVYTTLETLRVCGILLQPIMPSSMDRLLSRLAIAKSQRNINMAVFGSHQGGHALGNNIGHLFKKFPN